jgi:hypothetical protein
MHNDWDSRQMNGFQRSGKVVEDGGIE